MNARNARILTPAGRAPAVRSYKQSAPRPQAEGSDDLFL